MKLNGYQPTKANVVNNNWPIWSYEHMYTKGKPNELSKKFIDYMMTDEIQQKVVGKMGYIPINDMKVTRDLKGNVIDCCRRCHDFDFRGPKRFIDFLCQ